MTKLQQVIGHFLTLKNLYWQDINYKRYLRPAKELLTMCDDDLEKAKGILDDLKAEMDKNGLEWELGTYTKRPNLLKKLI